MIPRRTPPPQFAQLSREGFGLAIGLLPKGAAKYSNKNLESVRQAIEYPEVLAFEEVGLDYTVRPEEWGSQHVLLDSAFRVHIYVHIAFWSFNAGVLTTTPGI